MGLNLTYNDGQTPLDEDEKEGLLIQSIATRGELDEFEQQNIEDTIQYAKQHGGIQAIIKYVTAYIEPWYLHNTTIFAYFTTNVRRYVFII